MLYRKPSKALLLLAGAIHSAGFAAEYSLQTELAATTSHDDNIRLTADNPVSLSGTTVRPGLTAKVRSELWSLSLDTDLRFSEFNREGYDSDDQFITLSTERKTELQRFALSAKATHDTTRTSELEDSGRFTNERRKQYEVSPSWSYQLNARNSLMLSGKAVESTYASTSHIDYDYWQASLQWTYALNEKLDMLVLFNGASYESDQQQLSLAGPGFVIAQSYSTENETLGAQLGMSYQFSEKLNIFALLGESETDTEYVIKNEASSCSPVALGLCNAPVNESSTTHGEVKLSWKEERNRFSAGYNKQTQPSSNGYLTEYQSINLNWNYHLTEYAALTLTGSWGERQSLNGNNTVTSNEEERTYHNAALQYSHRFAENWYATATARYRQQEIETASSDADSNSIVAGITYKPQQAVWSR